MFPLREKKLIRGFEAHIQAGLDGAADYVASYKELIKPFDGTLKKSWGPEGGYWLTLTRTNGDVLKFAHLSQYVNLSARVGEVMAITGNTGKITTGPHLHLEIYREGKRIDPEKYTWMQTIHIATVGMSEGMFYQFRQKVAMLSGGLINLERTEYNYLLPPSINQDTGYFIANTLDVPEKFLFLCPQSSLTWQMSYYYPKLNQCISVMTLHGTPSMYAFEFKHQLFLWYNTNRGLLPALENMDWNAPTDDMIRGEFARITPYIELLMGLRYEEKHMTENEVRRLQALEGYKDEAGVAFWEGKLLSDYLTARLQDKINQIQNAL